MALTVGAPGGIETQLVLDRMINSPGVHSPCTKEGLGLVEQRVNEMHDFLRPASMARYNHCLKNQGACDCAIMEVVVELGLHAVGKN